VGSKHDDDDAFCVDVAVAVAVAVAVSVVATRDDASFQTREEDIGRCTFSEALQPSRRWGLVITSGATYVGCCDIFLSTRCANSPSHWDLESLSRSVGHSTSLCVFVANDFVLGGHHYYDATHLKTSKLAQKTRKK